MRRIFGIVCTIMFAISYLVCAQMELTIEQLKQRDVERALLYESLKDSQEPGPFKQISPRFLPEDSDDDGMADSWELANGLDPNDPDDAWLDPDGDEVINLFEYQLGSDLNDPNTPPVVTVAASGADYTDVATAIDSVAPGTVIRVAGGSYDVNYTTFSPKVVMIQGGWSPAFSHRDLKSYPTIFDGEMRDEILYFSVDEGEPVIILDGLHFVRGSGSFGAVNLLAKGSAFMRTSVLNCTITESTNNLFGSVLELHNWDMSESDRTIANTIIAGNGKSGSYDQITDDTVARWRIINTTITRNRDDGDGYGIEAFTLDNGTLTAHIYNSIIWGNEVGDISIRRNITFNVDHSDIDRVDAALGALYQTGPGMLNVDPLFADPANGDFHLQSSSPLIDAGIARGIPLIDFEGDPRVLGATVDIGADEQSQPQPPALGALVVLRFLKLEFVDPADWERTLREGCVVYKNISGEPSRIRVTLVDKSVLEFDIPAGNEVIVCGDVVHIDTRPK